ncbi:MAG: hypothetical protein FWG05_02565 [Kiritimatiellaeota bacterium]|nr:hypothetical protein [Kiritimatiellota bacterium]
MNLKRTVKPTITPFCLDAGDSIDLTLSNGKVWTMKLLESTARVANRANPEYNDGGHVRGNIGVYEFDALAVINGRSRTFHREVGAQTSFYQPWNIDGVTIWFDASAAAFRERKGFMVEKDWRDGFICCPTRLTRWAVQEEGAGICPEPLRECFPNPKRPLSINDCYMGEDCWMGPYNGAAAHCGLDINMRIGTPLFAPFSMDTQRLFNSLACGDRNNRWIGERRWQDGSIWQFQCHHIVETTLPANAPVRAGEQYATAAGVSYGETPHSHFMWRVCEHGGSNWLDPWILMSQTPPA